MRFPVLSALMLVFGVAAARAQSAHQVFPSEDAGPSLQAELLQVVCPGAEIGKKVVCRDPCPQFTGFSGESLDGWSATSAMHGHFFSPTTDDALLAMTGCEPHSNNF